MTERPHAAHVSRVCWPGFVGAGGKNRLSFSLPKSGSGSRSASEGSRRWEEYGGGKIVLLCCVDLELVLWEEDEAVKRDFNSLMYFGGSPATEV